MIGIKSNHFANKIDSMNTAVQHAFWAPCSCRTQPHSVELNTNVFESDHVIWLFQPLKICVTLPWHPRSLPAIFEASNITKGNNVPGPRATFRGFLKDRKIRYFSKMHLFGKKMKMELLVWLRDKSTLRWSFQPVWVAASHYSYKLNNLTLTFCPKYYQSFI